MIYLWMLGLAMLLMLPLLLVLFSRKNGARNRREAALGLHRAQLRELERDLGDGRIAVTEYNAARLEVERRLLAADAGREPALDGNARLLLAATVLAVPIMAFVLYLPGSTPGVPSEPHGQWVAQQKVMNARLNGIIAAIRQHLARVNPNSANASEGEAYLGEALSEQAGAVTPEALGLFRESLANAPANATWRSLDESRIAQMSQ